MFTGIKIESIKLRLSSLIGVGRFFHKEEHNEKILNIDITKVEGGGTQIAQQKIDRQIIVNFPERIAQSEQTKLLNAVLSGGANIGEEVSISPEAAGDAQLSTHTTNLSIENFLQKHHKEYLEDNNLLLDRGGLLYVYKERENISFSQDQLIYLMQSSLKNDFPVWFWLFNYRERFGSVVPLLQLVFRHQSLKIRRGVISSLNNFIDTADEVIALMEGERNPDILGFAASKFIEKNDVDRAQIVVANALTRKIIPMLTTKCQKKIEVIKIDLGVAEKRVLYNAIENGWQSEKLKALMILNLSAEEVDLLFLEKLLTQVTHANIINLVLACIKRIGKTTKAEYIRKELEKTRLEETFIAHLEVLIAVKYKSIFPQLLEWLSDSNRITDRFWTDTDHRKIDRLLQEAIGSLLDKDTYEILVQYILNHYSPDRYGNIMSWRHFWVLRQQKKRPEITLLLKSEARLKDFDGWADVAAEIELEEKTATINKSQLLSSVTIEKSDQAFIILRKLYEVITPEEAVVNIAPFINKFRENLISRLAIMASEEHPNDVKEIIKNDFEKFLGENQMFYRLYRKKEDSRQGVKNGEDAEFEKISKDIDNFSTIEKEYFSHIFKSKSSDINTILLNNIGRPYEIIYDSITKDRDNVEELSSSLLELINNNPSPLIKLKAIQALIRLSKGDLLALRTKTLAILIEARDNTKVSRGMIKNSDDWFVSEITYLWALNTLVEFGVPEDFIYIQEATNREKILARSYHRYSNFFDYIVIEELLSLSENLEDQEEKENALLALNSLDYGWTKKILAIES